MIAAWSRALLFATACSLWACGPKALELPEQPVDRAATCGIVAAAQARAGTADIKADLSFDAMGRILQYTLLGGSKDGAFDAELGGAVQKRMSELQDQVTGGKWQDLAPACRTAFPATAITDVKLPADRFEAQLGCYELDDYVRSALHEQAAYDDELSKLQPLREKLDGIIGTGLRGRVGGDFDAQQQERHKALATIAESGPPALVLRQCADRFG
jgi:hypothetical protein